MKVTNFAPGPTPVPDRVVRKMSAPILTHRSTEFSDLLRQVASGLQHVFQTENDVLVLTASGSGAMEAAVVNLLSPGDRVLAISGGKFGGRWVELCAIYGIDAVTLDVEWGTAADPDKVDRILGEQGPFEAVLATHSETSTGVLHDIETLGRIVRGHGCYLVVDAISGLGANELRTDDWHVDIALTGSQKALMIPPGLAFISVSERAWQRIEESRQPSYYLNLNRARDSFTKGLTPYTPAVSLLMGLAESLEMMKELGLEEIYRIHERNALVTRAGVAALGLNLFARRPSNVLTSVVMPPGIDGSDMLKSIKQECGVTIANGMDHYRGKYIRIAHLGYNVAPSDMIVALSALEHGLSQHGYEFESGAGVSAAERVIRETA
ncbi:MAG: alanine--glyoxylate aminotransferase family protein [Gemmatimonadetes bacterium]|nr:alanine--glyoxylate aminotransferase family protein [Gemmatimonadota bacterium]MYD25953.1 alanine--glyoxylate aminotransferase family protein [Gemmatimonadota bacterium]MYI99687.1 alanine--glyoxylate aminotransferase family protein [Gemmatimonadota bacterium]